MLQFLMPLSELATGIKGPTSTDNSTSSLSTVMLMYLSRRGSEATFKMAHFQLGLTRAMNSFPIEDKRYLKS